MNNEEAREFGLQLGFEDGDNIIGSAELVLGEGGSRRHHGVVGVISNSNNIGAKIQLVLRLIHLIWPLT